MATPIPTTFSSPNPNQNQNPTPQIPLPPSSSRRLPPPCWSDDETASLIDTYRDKWYSLRRSNLKANHWQEVADELAVRCPVNPPKTPVQCRHKMEKLRKRYRSEIQRAAPYVGARKMNPRFISTWVNFRRMDEMERGPAAEKTDNDEGEGEGEEIEQGQYSRYAKIHQLKPNVEICRNNVCDNVGSKFQINSNKQEFEYPGMINGGTGGRIRLPVRSAPGVAPVGKVYERYDEFGVPNANALCNPDIGLHYGGSSKGVRNEFVGRAEMGKKVRMEEVKEVSPIGEMVEAIRVLGEGFVRMERMKMDMEREIEEMRMEMEMKKTEMLIEAQQGIVEAFAKTMSESRSKKQKIIPTPDRQ